MTTEEAKEVIDRLAESFKQMMRVNKSLDFSEELKALDVADFCMDISKAKENSRWTKITYREATEEEKESWGEDIAYIYTCRLPEDGQQVIVTLHNGTCYGTVFYNDSSYGPYFEYFEDVTDVKAWMPMPDPWKEHEVSEKKNS